MNQPPPFLELMDYSPSTERALCHQQKLCGRGHWRPVEDAELQEHVSRHGPQNWNLIAEKLPGRSGIQKQKGRGGREKKLGFLFCLFAM